MSLQKPRLNGRPIAHRWLPFAALILLALRGDIVAAQSADRTGPTEVPAGIEAPLGYRPYLAGHAVGTQNYICVSTTTAPAWLFIGPQATVFDASGQQILTHFQSGNPFALGAIQATWQHSRDSSVVWAKKLNGSTDPNYVAPDAVEWLLLEVTGATEGPTEGERLVAADFIQRLNTVGGKAPTTACNAALLNQRQLVPYEADYVFYRQIRPHGGR